MLGCLVLGGEFFHLNFDTKEITTVSFLQEKIKKKKENDFREIDPDKLKLWKVKIPAGDDRLKLLMSNAEIDIASIAINLGGAEFLDPMLNITRYFPATYSPPEEHVHILVKPPQPATGKCLPMVYLLNKNKYYCSKLRTSPFINNIEYVFLMVITQLELVRKRKAVESKKLVKTWFVLAIYFTYK